MGMGMVWLAVAGVLVAGLPAGASESLEEVCQVASAFNDAIAGFVVWIGPMGLALVGMKAFQGRMPWGPFIAILVGLFVFYNIPDLVAFLTDGQGSLACR
jgi:type IV secretory pathway VirB2 component (pilin)